VKRNGANAVGLALVSMILVALSPVRTASAQEGREAAESGPTLNGRWLARIDPWHGIPQDLALRYGQAALETGLTKSQAARMLNDDRFALAVGSPDQGYGLLEAMIADPEQILRAHELLMDDRYTASGADSLQTALIDVFPELRNAYLRDIGLTAVEDQRGVLILVDIETGRQYFDGETLGGQVLAPGGKPLPIPSISPEEAAAQMWENAGIDPDDPNPIENLAAGRPQGPTGPGFNFDTDDPSQGLFTPGVYLVLAAFLIAWMGYGVVTAVRRFRRS
jgi:hypothetical protein